MRNLKLMLDLFQQAVLNKFMLIAILLFSKRALKNRMGCKWSYKTFCHHRLAIENIIFCNSLAQFLQISSRTSFML